MFRFQHRGFHLDTFSVATFDIIIRRVVIHEYFLLLQMIEKAGTRKQRTSMNDDGLKHSMF